jgi:hypothetical protein
VQRNKVRGESAYVVSVVDDVEMHSGGNIRVNCVCLVNGAVNSKGVTPRSVYGNRI